MKAICYFCEMFLKKNIETLVLLRNVISLLSDEEYQKPLSALQQSSVGKHVRHILDFYFCFLEATKTQTICYDLRERNIKIEKNVAFSILKIDDIIQFLSSFDNDFTIKNLTMKLEGETISIETTTKRELLYCFEHAIHHKAIIKIALHLLKPELNIAKEFGVAYSTLEYSSKN